MPVFDSFYSGSHIFQQFHSFSFVSPLSSSPSLSSSQAIDGLSRVASYQEKTNSLPFYSAAAATGVFMPHVPAKNIQLRILDKISVEDGPINVKRRQPTTRIHNRDKRKSFEKREGDATHHQKKEKRNNHRDPQQKSRVPLLMTLWLTRREGYHSCYYLLYPFPITAWFVSKK